MSESKVAEDTTATVGIGVRRPRSPDNPEPVFRTATLPQVAAHAVPLLVRHSSHAQDSFETFSDRHVKNFQGAEDLFEVQRLNNCFAHDLLLRPSLRLR